jgi:hypothetical protein
MEVSQDLEVVILGCMFARAYRQLDVGAKARILLDHDDDPWMLPVIQRALAIAEWHDAEIDRRLAQAIEERRLLERLEESVS